MRKVLLVSIFILSLLYSNTTYSQYISKGFWGGFELDYGLTLSDRGKGYKHKFGGDTKMQMASIRSVMGYYIVPSFSIGTGVGLSTYSKQRVNTIPIFIDFRIHPLSKINENFYININIGTFLGDNQKRINSQTYWEAAIGYKLFDFGSCNLAPSIGFQHYKYKNEILNGETNLITKRTQRKRTLFFRLSLTY